MTAIKYRELKRRYELDGPAKATTHLCEALRDRQLKPEDFSLRDLAEGHSRFCELERSLSGISPRTLSLRLRALEEAGIVERHTFPEMPPRVEYALTEKGLALLPIVDDMRAYGERWLSAECAGHAVAADATLAAA